MAELPPAERQRPGDSQEANNSANDTGLTLQTPPSELKQLKAALLQAEQRCLVAELEAARLQEEATMKDAAASELQRQLVQAGEQRKAIVEASGCEREAALEQQLRVASARVGELERQLEAQAEVLKDAQRAAAKEGSERVGQPTLGTMNCDDSTTLQARPAPGVAQRTVARGETGNEVAALREQVAALELEASSLRMHWHGNSAEIQRLEGAAALSASEAANAEQEMLVLRKAVRMRDEEIKRLEKQLESTAKVSGMGQVAALTAQLNAAVSELRKLKAEEKLRQEMGGDVDELMEEVGMHGNHPAP